MKKTKTLVVIISSLIFLFSPSGVYAVDTVIVENGSEAQNSINIESDEKNSTDTQNTVQITNNIKQSVNTGRNEASQNSGSSNIKTGDAKSETSTTNSANTTLVNQSDCCELQDSNQIGQNGTNSQNSIENKDKSVNNTTIANSANIQNNLSIDANTGDNRANLNKGEVHIATGDVGADVVISNLDINTTSVSQSVRNKDAQNLISDNSFSTTNKIASSSQKNSEVDISSNANIYNSISSNFNTGKNSAKKNVGGVDIKTGNLYLSLNLFNGPINFNSVAFDCCGFSDPADDNKSEDEKKDKTSEDEPKEEQKGDTKDSQKEQIGEILPKSASTENLGGVEILGLSDTANESSQSLLFFAGLIFIALGIKNLAIYSDKTGLAYREK